jgi:hypothetical protein
MDEITELLDEAASRLRAFTFDVDALVSRTRLVRRRRRTLQVASSALGVVAVLGASFAAAAALGTGHSTSPAVAASTTALVPRPTTVVTVRTGPPSVHVLRPTPMPALPRGFAQACSKPGTKLTVRIVPVTIPHRICDLSGVEIDRPGQVTAVVPPRGQAISVAPVGSAGHPLGLSIKTDQKTGDVTISTP